ncbi:LysR family transcriptional regulator, partial [Gemmata sp. JC673]|nr:LysR family transcriptional regulator [Gemmata algarum]
AQARSYLGNNRDRMNYPRYRREGLPTTSSLVESLVGEINARVKSTQKHWTRPAGAEPILQVRAAVLSQDDRLPRFFAQRPGCAFRKRDTLSHELEDATTQTVA